MESLAVPPTAALWMLEIPNTAEIWDLPTQSSRKTGDARGKEMDKRERLEQRFIHDSNSPNSLPPRGNPPSPCEP